MDKDKINLIYKTLIADGFEIAKEHCNGGYPNPSDCAWYHGNWMMLRFLGLVSNPFWHEDFYKKALQDLVGHSDKKVLVAGTADFSMPLLCQEAGVKNISVCDICETPLIFCKKASKLINVNWNVFRQDITADFGTHYDVIINDAFLSRFMDKKAVLSAISNLLSERGYYITTLKKGVVNKGGEVSLDLKKSFLSKAKDRYQLNMDTLPNVDIEKIITTYINNMSSYPAESMESVKKCFNSSGLDVITIESGDVEGEYEASKYYRIIARKKG